MDIEHLSRTQIILLALLCTFVASIATAIVTVSLLAQAPPAVTQTVNHIIQRTVEAVTPTVTGTGTTVKETTVVVKEDDLVTASVASSLTKLARVHEGLSTTTPVVALGVMVSGVLLTDSSLVTDQDHMVAYENSAVVYKTKKRYGDVSVAVLEPKEGTQPSGFRIGGADSVKLGQSVIALSSASGSRIGLGAISARYTLARVDNAGEEVPIRALETNISSAVVGGAPLINVFGDVVGIATGASMGEAGGPGTFIAVSDFMNLIGAVKGTSTPTVAE